MGVDVKLGDESLPFLKELSGRNLRIFSIKKVWFGRYGYFKYDVADLDMINNGSSEKEASLGDYITTMDVRAEDTILRIKQAVEDSTKEGFLDTYFVARAKRYMFLAPREEKGK